MTPEQELRAAALKAAALWLSCTGGGWAPVDVVNTARVFLEFLSDG